jgi:iron complex transport system ATP-binding protein
MTPILEAENVSVRVGTKMLLDHVSLRLTAGESLAVAGPNGAGKSTLLRVLSGEICPGTGVVRVRGRDLRSLSPRLLAYHRAVLPQSTSVTFPFTVAEVVRMGAGNASGAKVDALVDEALAAVDLSTFRERAVPTLSGGEQQRTHFARTLVQLRCGEEAVGPGLLLLDEPTASLDLRHQLDIAALTRQCSARSIAVVAILHDLNLATLFADRLLVLDRGRLAADGRIGDTITDDLLASVFRIEVGVSRLPPQGVPFVLPQAGIGR